MALFVVCSSCAPGTPEQTARSSGQRALLGAELGSALSGKTAHGVEVGSELPFFIVFHAPDGKARLRAGATASEARSAAQTPGTWRVAADGSLCTRAGEGDERCERIYVVRGKYFAYSRDGSLSRTFRLEPGDVLTVPSG